MAAVAKAKKVPTPPTGPRVPAVDVYLTKTQLSDDQRAILNRAYNMKPSCTFRFRMFKNRSGTKVFMYERTKNKTFRHCINCLKRLTSKDEVCTDEECGQDQQDYTEMEKELEDYYGPLQHSLLIEEKPKKAKEKKPIEDAEDSEEQGSRVAILESAITNHAKEIKKIHNLIKKLQLSIDELSEEVPVGDAEEDAEEEEEEDVEEDSEEDDPADEDE